MLKPLLEAVFEELRKEKIVRTQTEFAEQLGITKGHMSTLIKQTGEVPPKIRTKLNEKFGISLLWLVSGGKDGNMFAYDIPDTGKQDDIENVIDGKNNPSKDKSISSEGNAGNEFVTWQSLNEKAMLLKENQNLTQAVADLSFSNRELVAMQRELHMAHMELMSRFTGLRNDEGMGKVKVS